jgi:hypothetical protein
MSYIVSTNEIVDLSYIKDKGRTSTDVPVDPATWRRSSSGRNAGCCGQPASTLGAFATLAMSR